MPDNHKLRITALGGLGEIGRNMMLIEHGDDAVVIDAGVQFSDHTMPGVDLALPNFLFLAPDIYRKRLRALLITHGHEDHIGGIPYFMKTARVPIYAPPMAAELINRRLKENGIKNADINLVEDGGRRNFGNIAAEWFHVCHSLPDSMGIKLDTALGNVIHTGDFKFDHNPKIGEPTDLLRLADIMEDSPFLLMSDSTYAEKTGYSGSDLVAEQGLSAALEKAAGRTIVTSFASQVARIQMVVDIARRLGKKVALAGGMKRSKIIAERLGWFAAPANTLISLEDAMKMPRRKVILLVPGSQGEASSVLSRVAAGRHGSIRVAPGDTVVMSSSPIPGNESAIQRLVNRLTMLGAEVILNSAANPIHVRGHAHRDELRMLLNLARPQYFVPIHGEYRMLAAHAELAVAQGMPPENVFVITNGQSLEMDVNRGIVSEGFADGAALYVQGKQVIKESDPALNQRIAMSRAGAVMVSVGGNLENDHRSLRLAVSCAGIPDGAQIIAITREALEFSFAESQYEGLDLREIEGAIVRDLARVLYKQTKLRPLILCNVVEI